MSTSTDPIQLRNLDSRIRSVWQRSQLLHLAQGVLAFCRWAVLLFVIGVAFDWFVQIPAVVRGGFLITLLSVSFYKAWYCGWRKLRGFNATHTALKLERHYGGMDSLLVSAVQLRDRPTVAGASDSLLGKTCREAEEAASTLRPAKAVPFEALRRPAVIIVLLISLIGVFATVNGPFLRAGLSRIFAPWLATAYPTYTQIELGEGDLVVKQGAGLRIEAGVSGVVPEMANLLLRTGEGRARELALNINDGACEYTIGSTSRDFTYQIKAGDARTDWYAVQVIPAPRVENVQVDLEFPAYLQRATETIEALTLTVPEGTKINWQLTLDRPISEAVFNRDGEQPLKLNVSSDGFRVKFSSRASDSRGYSFSWVDKEHGFEFNSSRYYLQVASDQPPQVELTSPSANLIAMLGRPLSLATRARDDHSIATAKVTYRVNRRPEESIDFSSPIRNGEGDQVIDWDYRAALPDLNVGDTVSFAVEVSDRYPGPNGPHRARSETRRVTFLSKEEYLKQIEEKKNRLLSHVRTVYRQQRAAHELVRNLNPEDESYRQSCQLEAIRQEMLRNQVNDIAFQIQDLLDDLAANNVSDALQGESLNHVRLALQTIAEKHVANAAQLLRGLVGTPESDKSAAREPVPAAQMVNTAARELGSLVMLRDIDSAQEVFARETHMLAQIQASLRWRTATNEAGAEAISTEQTDLAQWTKRLILDLQNGMRYDRRPLAVLRLTRSVKELRAAQIEASIQHAIAEIRSGQMEQAALVQSELARTYLNAEFSVRLSGAYSTLIKTRNVLQSLAEAQLKLRDETAASGFESRRAAIMKQQTALRKQLLTLLLPTVPAPRARLFDQALPSPPPVERLLAEADQAMAEALSQIANIDQEAAMAEQRKAEQSLIALTEIVNRWSVETGLQTQALGTLVAATSERLSRIEEFEARVVGLLEKTDIAAVEEQKVDILAEPQVFLVEELDQFLQELAEQNQLNPDQDLPPIMSRLEQAKSALNLGIESLRKNSADDAMEDQEQAADGLAEAYAIVAAQNERLSLLQDLLMFQRAVAFANGYMADIVAEQRDLLAATEAADTEAADSENGDISKLMPQLRHLRGSMEAVAPLLDMVAARLDVGTPLAFAKTDFEDAMDSLKAGDKLDAIDAQDAAAESLGEVQELVGKIQTQTGYVAEIVEFLHAATSDTALMRYRQRELKTKVNSAERNQLKELGQEQTGLLDSADRYARLLTAATGMSAFAKPAEWMGPARDHLNENDAGSAAEQMELAESTLSENAETLFTVISMLHGLPSIEVTTQTEPALIRLIDGLSLASDHKMLLRKTEVADPKALAALADRQRELAQRCKEIAEAGEPHEFLNAAKEHLSKAVAAFESSDRDAIRQQQAGADERLRHFIVEQALILETAKPPAGPSDGDPGDDGEGSDDESAFAAGFISDFVSGETPQDKRTGWKVLGERNRASLNQNFARELPLEYRGLLKNYYERVAK